MNRYITGIDEITKQVIYVPEETGLPDGFIEIGDFHHPGNLDELGPAINHVLFHHFRDLMYKRGRTDLQSFKFVDVNYDFDVDIPIRWISATANGVSGEEPTTEIALEFDKDPIGLTVEDISIVGATKLGLSITGSTRILRISGLFLKDQSNLQISINPPDGYSFNIILRNCVINNTNIASLKTYDDYNIPWESDFYLYPQDENGYSIIPWPVTGTVSYIDSENGNDATAIRYHTGDFADMENPVGEMAYATWEAAFADLTAFDDNMILFKRGQMHPITGNTTFGKKGISKEQRIVISAYGVGERPKIKPEEGKAFLRFWAEPKFVYIKGLEYYHPYSDPYSPEYTDKASGEKGGMISMNIFTNDQDGSIALAEHIGVEDCYANYALLVGTGANVESGRTETFTYRKNIVMNSYERGSGHSQGAYFADCQILCEDNFFHGNGWLDDPTYYIKGTVFNHNIYSPNVYKSIYRRNISSSPSSIHFKFTSNPDGLIIHRAANYDGITSELMVNNYIPPKFPQSGVIEVRSDDNTRTTVNYTGWSGKTIEIEPTDFTDHPVTGLGRGKIEYTENFPLSYDVAIYDNVFLDGEIGLSIGGNYQLYGPHGRWDGYRIFNNVFSEMGLSQPTERKLGYGVELSDHRELYMSENLFLPTTNPEINNTFSIFVTGSAESLNIYNNLSYGLGEIQVGMPEFVYSNLDVQDSNLLVDSSYNLLSYMTELGLEASYDNFVQKCQEQSSTNYDSDFNPNTIINRLRERFALKTPIVIVEDILESTFAVSGEIIKVSVSAFANTRLSYEWFINGMSVGNDSNKLNIDTAQLGNGVSTIYVEISDDFGNSLSSRTLTLDVKPYRYVHTIRGGDRIDFDLTANGGVATNSMIDNRGMEYTIKISPNVSFSNDFGAFGINNTKFENDFKTYRMRFGGPIYKIDITNARVNDDLYHKIKFINDGLDNPIKVIIDGTEYVSYNKSANILDAMNYFLGDEAGDYNLMDVRYFTVDPVTREETDFAFFALDDELFDGATVNATEGGGTVTYNIASSNE